MTNLAFSDTKNIYREFNINRCPLEAGKSIALQYSAEVGGRLFQVKLEISPEAEKDSEKVRKLIVSKALLASQLIPDTSSEEPITFVDARGLKDRDIFHFRADALCTEGRLNKIKEITQKTATNPELKRDLLALLELLPYPIMKESLISECVQALETVRSSERRKEILEKIKVQSSNITGNWLAILPLSIRANGLNTKEDRVDLTSWGPILLAAVAGDAAFFEELASGRIDINQRDASDDTPFYAAIKNIEKKPYLELTCALLNIPGCNPNEWGGSLKEHLYIGPQAKDDRKKSPLYYAIANNNLPMTTFLLQLPGIETSLNNEGLLKTLITNTEKSDDLNLIQNILEHPLLSRRLMSRCLDQFDLRFFPLKFREILERRFPEIIEAKAQNVESVRQQVLAPSQPAKKAEPLSLEQLNKKIRFFSCYRTNPEQIAAELFENVSEHIHLTDLVNAIFNEALPRNILLILDAFLIAHPSFKLSPFDKIRRTIVEDVEHTLNNDSLMSLLKRDALETDKEKLTACYDVAYRTNHPFIYPLSQERILPSDYSLNFLWINLNPQDRAKDAAQSIFGDGLDPFENADFINDPQGLRSFEENEEALGEARAEDWKKIKKSFAYRISKWADLNPGAEINLWYDSALVTRQAQQNTFQMMRGISESRGVNLKLRDVRQLSNVSREIGNSLHPGTPVYYRVDILKALIADYMVRSKDSPKYCVVSDIDVHPMPPQQIFDQRTVDFLSNDGYVYNRVGLLDNFENSFFIFNKEKEFACNVHRETIIEQTDRCIQQQRLYFAGPSTDISSHFVFNLYVEFRKQTGEKGKGAPRKVVKCPQSQFVFGGKFLKSDHQAEEFRFIGNSNVPYTRNGRNRKEGECPIEELRNWKAEPLE